MAHNPCHLIVTKSSGVYEVNYFHSWSLSLSNDVVSRKKVHFPQLGEENSLC